MNSVTLLGRLTRDVEKAGKSIALSLATEEGYSKAERLAKVHFVNVYVNGLSEKTVAYLQKGKQVLVRDAIVESIKGKDGLYKTVVSVFADGVVLLGGGVKKNEGE